MRGESFPDREKDVERERERKRMLKMLI